jgi:hypothetical protein
MENHDILDQPLSSAPATTPEYTRIGGWLILPAIGLVFTPVIFAIGVFTSIAPLLSNDVWHELTHPDGQYYHPRLGAIIAFELIGSVVMMIISTILAIFFFQKRRFVPLAMIAFYAVNLVFLIADYLLLQSIPSIAQTLSFEGNRQLIRAITTAMIWIPYFAISERVKGTFVH